MLQWLESRLVDDWHKVVLHSWSLRIMVGGLLVEIVPEYLPLAADWIPSWAYVGILGAALGARIIRQKKVSGPVTNRPAITTDGDATVAVAADCGGACGGGE